MKLITITSILCFLAFSLFAQNSGTINYTHVMKLKIEFEGETHGIDISSMLPDSRTIYCDLTFNKEKSLYEEVEMEEEDMILENEDATIQIVIGQDDSEEKLYHNYAENKRIKQTGFMGKDFLISESIDKIQWKITGEKLKYLDYECIKATSTNEEGQMIVAWFTPQIPLKVGPDNYGQLPGAILMLSVGEDDHVYKATSVSFQEQVAIQKPEKGKKVTQEEFEKIMEEKMKEMEMQMGKGNMIIRG